MTIIMVAQVFTYNKHQILSFGNTTGRYGGLSNMAPDYMLFVNEICIPYTESLFQACKFSLYPSIQKQILEERNPMKAKMISKKYQVNVRQDWEQIKYLVMEWCLRVKLLQNWDKFGGLLRDSEQSIIVKYSTKDTVWGAIPKDTDILEGENALGRLLMKIRSEYIDTNTRPDKILPPDITGFLLYGNSIGVVYTPEYYLEDL